VNSLCIRDDADVHPFTQNRSLAQGDDIIAFAENLGSGAMRSEDF
jgi:hypothetical protein